MEVGRPWPGRDEAVIPLGKNGATGGITVINEFHIMAVDPDGTRKVVNDYIIPAIAKSLQREHPRLKGVDSKESQIEAARGVLMSRRIRRWLARQLIRLLIRVLELNEGGARSELRRCLRIQ